MLATKLRGWRTGFAASLRFRVLFLTLAVFVAVAIPACMAFVWMVNSTVVQLGTLFAEKQILYDRYRGLETLMRETALAETLARSPTVMEWAADESSPEKRARGVAELEHFRLAFRDQSYFLVINGSGNYYFNDAADSYAGRQLRYTLTPANPRDGWYYKTLENGPGCQLNVDNDDKLGVTKVWINCVVSQDGKLLGILGTGIDLSAFIRDVVNPNQVGVDSLFVDRSGAIQADRDARRIDFHSLTKDMDNKQTVFQMIDDDSGRKTLSTMLAEVTRDSSKVEARFITMGGHAKLVGIGFLDRLGWYNVTIMDVDRIIDRSLFLPIGGLLAAMLVAAAALVTFLFKRTVLDRLSRTEAALRRVEAGEYTLPPADSTPDEIGHLDRALRTMAVSVRDNTAMLEDAVRDRTEKLRRIAFLDSLTGVINRRGFVDAFVEAQSVPGARLGLLVLDVDRFKSVNDARGHQAGDEVIMEVARRLTTIVLDGEHGVCARWGGDEFVILVSDCDNTRLSQIARSILDGIRSRPVPLSEGRKIRVTISIGGHLVSEGEALETAAHKADMALYEAKRSGRNRLVVFEEGAQGSDGARVA